MIKKIIQLSLILSIFGYLAFQIYKNWGLIKQVDWNINFFSMAFSLIMLLFGGVIISLNWLLILRFNGEKITFLDSTRNWAMANLGKYIPGKVVQYASRIYLFDRLGIRKEQTIVYMILEIIYMLDSCLLVFGAINLVQPLGKSVFSLGMKGIIFSIVLLINMLVLHPVILQKIVYIGGRIFRREVKLIVQITFKHSVWLIVMNILFWVLYGLSFSVFINSFIPLHLRTHLFLIEVNTVAHFIGVLSVVAPGGLGVREGVLTYFLGSLSNLGFAGILSIIWRIWGIVGEIIFCLFAYIVSGRR